MVNINWNYCSAAVSAVKHNSWSPTSPLPKARGPQLNRAAHLQQLFGSASISDTSHKKIPSGHIPPCNGCPAGLWALHPWKRARADRTVISPGDSSRSSRRGRGAQTAATRAYSASPRQWLVHYSRASHGSTPRVKSSEMERKEMQSRQLEALWMHYRTSFA